MHKTNTKSRKKIFFWLYCLFSIQALIFQWRQTMELERSLRVWMWNQLLKTNQVGLDLLHQCLLTLNIMRTVFLWGTPLPPKKCWSPHLWLLFLAPGYGQILTLIYETKLSTSLPRFINKLSMQIIWLVYFYWIFFRLLNFLQSNSIWGEMSIFSEADIYFQSMLTFNLNNRLFHSLQRHTS